MFSLEGRTVLVTGAARGIGAAVLRRCLDAGARVLAHASARSAASDAVARELGSAAGEFLFEDLSRPGAGERLVARAVARSPDLDAVVNNAGVYKPTPLADDALWREGWEEIVAINLRAPADICRAVIPRFQAKRGGRIVNVASRAGQRGDGPDHAGYAASKGGLLALTRTYARAFAGDNILFYAVAPGWVETRMAPEDIAARRKAVGEIPLGRAASPEEVAALIAFLLSDACASATGATFDVNGASYVR